MSIRVAVVGAAGRMGRTVCEAVGAAEDMELVAELDAGDAITRESLGGAEVAVEFSVPGAAEANALAILDSGADAVVGTTGWTDEALERVRARAEKTGRSAVIAPNYALSAVLAMSFAERAAPFFESVEVIEMHHPDKADAPSGTAISTASRIARARAAAGVSPGPDATETDPFGARGADYDGVRVHACAGSTRTSRSSWATPASSWSSGKTPSTARASCPASCWPCGPCEDAEASPGGSRPSWDCERRRASPTPAFAAPSGTRGRLAGRAQIAVCQQCSVTIVCPTSIFLRAPAGPKPAAERKAVRASSSARAHVWTRCAPRSRAASTRADRRREPCPCL